MKKIIRLSLTILSLCLFLQQGIISADDDPPIYVGVIDAELLMANFPAFNTHQHQPILHQSAIGSLGQLKQSIQIKVFFGTWCHDSQREIPRLLDVLKAANNPNLELSLLALDHYKQDPQGLAQQYAIKSTPTIIIKEDGKELGRIVESANKTIEEDLLTIIQAKKNSQ